ncbi:hypothetical protein TD95_003735 [Thielaviopsis punctulata]|uniref:Gamma-glutamyltransferase n=1 Tax=Thielaviopsis punctulata TaxID=72032 RepID=A0A0F4Z9C2_9PEZI|nr:hypothetical protein TD95_003735 [Thielaviopsis punctulata]
MDAPSPWEYLWGSNSARSAEIATYGADAFYTGDIANATARALQADNGIMTMEDLANYTVEIRDVAQIEYRGHKVTSTQAPSGGIVALSALNILNGYTGFDNESQFNLNTQRLNEAMRFAYGMRTKLGDPLFDEGLAEYTESMISSETAAEVRAKILDNQTFPVAYYNPDGLESLPTPGTSHISTADKSGLAVALTTTVNLYFGSHLCVPETGVVMNDEMNDFSIPGSSNAFGYIPSESNYIRPGKRPQSSISPTIVEKDGRLVLVVGAAGGSRIISATIQNVINSIDRGMSCYEALLQPRLHDQLSPAYTSFETTFDNATVDYLHRIGHNVSWVAPGQSTAQAVRLLPNGTFEAAGEPRQLSSGGYAV